MAARLQLCALGAGYGWEEGNVTDGTDALSEKELRKLSVIANCFLNEALDKFDLFDKLLELFRRSKTVQLM